jgi:hypothetical protein
MEGCTAEFQKEVHEKILNDNKKKLTPTDKKGVACSMHYKSLTLQSFVPPLLHLEIGMVNHVWDNVENWIDDSVEMIPPHEQDARKKVMEALENLSDASKEKEDAEKTINVEIREKDAMLWVDGLALVAHLY